MTPDNQLGGERRLAAIMFTDMVGFTALSQRDEAYAMQLLDEQRSVIRAQIGKHGGQEIKTMGDGTLVEFGSSLSAVEAAIEMQKVLAGLNADRPEARRAPIRIGIHLGDVIHREMDVAGDAVNVASRIEPLAPPGGLCITAEVHAGVANKIPESFESIGKPSLKNVSTPIEVFRLQGFGQSLPKAAPPAPGTRLAVLPFLNISQDPADEYFADGMTEELIGVLSQTRGLSVIARTSVMRYKKTERTVSEIAKELNVGSVLEGSVRKADRKLRISVQLIDGASEEPRWSQTYDRDLQDVFAIQSDIAGRVAEALPEHVLERKAPAKSTTTRSTKAYVNYLLGRQLWNTRTEPDLRRAVEYFEKSIRSDPKYARAYTGLADTYAVLALLEFMPPTEAFPRAREAVDSALGIDGELADAHTSLGLIRFQYEWDWEGAEAEFLRALELQPGYAVAHHYYADFLKAVGRFDEAIQQIETALELDPLSLAINTGVGHVYYLARQYDHAIEQYQRAVDLDPSFMATHLWFGRPYLEKGMFEEALRELQTAVELSGESTVALGMLGHGLASAGRESDARQILEKLQDRARTQYVPSYWIAVIHNGFRARDEVVAWMQKAYEERSSWLVWSNVEPRFDWVRSDPDFAALMKKMKLI